MKIPNIKIEANIIKLYTCFLNCLSANITNNILAVKAIVIAYFTPINRSSKINMIAGKNPIAGLNNCLWKIDLNDFIQYSENIR